jgi:glycerol-3-phosphate cytidylyltransferase
MRLYTCGSFDLFNARHVDFLKSCKNLVGFNGEVVVGLNSDDFVKELKGSDPVYSYSQRFELLKSCRFVDAVIANEGKYDSKLTISKVKPNLLVFKSYLASIDYYSMYEITQDWLDANKIILAFVPYSQKI